MDEMKYGKHFQKQMKDPVFLKALAQEQLIADIQEEICRLMKEGKVSRNELALRMGKSKGFITQILSNDRNLTLRTIADVFTALRAEITVKTKTKEKEAAETVVFLPEYKLQYQAHLKHLGDYNYQPIDDRYRVKDEIHACI